MQNAWRFVDDEVLRERLKEAKGIGTPATRAEIIGGLKKQGFLIAQGKHIVPTEAGLSLFGVLKQADPALVDPGVTAQLECLLDDVVVGKQTRLPRAWIDSNRSAKRRKRGRKTAYKPAGSVAPRSIATTKRSRKRKPDAFAAPPAQPNSVTATPLRIPYGNKEVALKLGARYRSGGWYAPPGVDLSAFGARGWL